MALFNNRFLFIVICLFALLPITGQGQYRIAVDWQVPNSETDAIKQLEKLKSLGITEVTFEESISPTIWNKIEDLNLQVYGDLGITFPISDTFSKPDSSFLEMVSKRTRTLLSHPSVKAIGLFSFGPIHRQKFIEATRPYFQELQEAQNIRIFFTKSVRQKTKNLPGADFSITNVPVNTGNVNDLEVPSDSVGFYKFSPSRDLRVYLSPFQSFLKVVPRNSTIFLNSDWLFASLNSFPAFKTTLESLSEKEYVFPLPDEKVPNQEQSPIPIILLIILWASAALHYNVSPLYRKSVFRYFTAHKFFVDDIFRRHIRTPVPALVLILQNTLIMGAIVFTAASVLFNPLGLEALYSFLGTKFDFGNTPKGLAIAGAIFAFCLSNISILWLYISSKKIRSTIQTATLYTWPLHVNFLLGTVIISIYSSGSGPEAIITLTVIAFLIQLGSFIFSAIDFSQFIRRHALRFYLSTNGIYLLMLISAIIWIYFSADINEMLSLALAL